MKTCSHTNCNNPVFSHGTCKYHYRYKPKVSKKIVVKSEQSQIELFNKVWTSRPHVSELSGDPLDCYYGTSLWFSCFAHCLPKGRFARYKYLEENIILVTPEEHRLIDQGTADQRLEYPEVNWDLFYQKYEYLKRRYSEEEKQFINF
jgi:hypothetical protein